MKNLVNNINRLEYENKTDMLLFEFLYGQEGFLSLKSKNAISNMQNYIDKFNYEINKLNEEYKIETNNYISSKIQKEFIEKIESHIKNEILNWLDLVFNSKMENIFFKTSLNKNNKKELCLIFEKMINLINWYAKIKNYTKDEYYELLKRFYGKFENAMKEDFIDSIPKQNPIKTNPEVYFKLLDDFIKSQDSFIYIDLEEYKNDLNKDDYLYFELLKKTINSTEITQNLDEINLILSACEILNIKNKSQKYEFLNKIKNDFKMHKLENKKLNEEDKIKIIKRRIEIFKDNSSSNFKYFKQKLLNN